MEKLDKEAEQLLRWMKSIHIAIKAGGTRCGTPLVMTLSQIQKEITSDLLEAQSKEHKKEMKEAIHEAQREGGSDVVREAFKKGKHGSIIKITNSGFYERKGYR